MATGQRLSGADGRTARARAFAAVAVAVASLHLALLGGGFARWTPPPRAPAAVHVRTVAVPRPAAVTVAAVPPVERSTGAAALPVERRPAAAPPSVASRIEAALPPSVAPAPVGETGSRQRQPQRQGAVAALPVAADAAATADAAVTADADAVPMAGAAPSLDDDTPPPVYRTRLPPSMTLHYALRRNGAEGEGELRWQLDADGYALDWRSRVGDVLDASQSSTGRIDAAGIAPLRLVDRRAARPATAVNFRRDTGRIAFSRKAADAALLPGAQDRLSWLVQIAAVVAADPARRERGAELRLSVAGAGGDVAVWRFRCDGAESVALGAGRVDALHFVRDARGPYDLRVEVWLDPADGHYLPVRATWRSAAAGDGDGVELLRRAL